VGNDNGKDGKKEMSAEGRRRRFGRPALPADADLKVVLGEDVSQSVKAIDRLLQKVQKFSVKGVHV
jgi:hypothetical protein